MADDGAVFAGYQALLVAGAARADRCRAACHRRDDVRAGRDERRLDNRLRADLLAVFPAAVEIADGDLGSALFLSNGADHPHGNATVLSQLV